MIEESISSFGYFQDYLEIIFLVIFLLGGVTILWFFSKLVIYMWRLKNKH